MSGLGAPASGVDVRVVGINPEVIGMTPAIKVELGEEKALVVSHSSWSPAQPGGPPGSRRLSPSLGLVRSKILNSKGQGAKPIINCLGRHIFHGLHSLSYWCLLSMLG